MLCIMNCDHNVMNYDYDHYDHDVMNYESWSFTKFTQIFFFSLSHLLFWLKMTDLLRSLNNLIWSLAEVGEALSVPSGND